MAMLATLTQKILKQPEPETVTLTKDTAERVLQFLQDFTAHEHQLMVEGSDSNGNGETHCCLCDGEWHDEYSEEEEDDDGEPIEPQYLDSEFEHEYGCLATRGSEMHMRLYAELRGRLRQGRVFIDVPEDSIYLVD